MAFKKVFMVLPVVGWALIYLNPVCAEENRPVVLVTNDDGIDAAELETLACALARVARVIVVAPKVNMGGASSMARDLDAMAWSKTELECILHAYWLDGPPIAVVRWGILQAEKIYSQWPDLVISGINPGPNLGGSNLYSGTIGAAREAAYHGIKSIAVSNWRGPGADIEGAAGLTATFAMKYVEMDESADYVNLNFPKGPLKTETPMVITFPHDLPGRIEFFPVENDSTVSETVKMVLRLDRSNVKSGSDLQTILDGKISITPMQMELMDSSVTEELERAFGSEL